MLSRAARSVARYFIFQKRQTTAKHRIIPLLEVLSRSFAEDVGLNATANELRTIHPSVSYSSCVFLRMPSPCMLYFTTNTGNCKS